ncbi:30S ribosomal protein S7 [Phototrophicus methaneseepsis]|uniref:Small ribosomal subunit protein uS7 n=1 Tax=Phototrophicus methaneseepsis TaxID=2710758 RepID=A0A7S8ED59_9CHLR|nr:30S ribosomal protein S7 [Phototrophicus methaneseepsis]QPC84797.1 30S ribosomal protein S7 [Phototrophicus methaneseepsis]
MRRRTPPKHNVEPDPKFASIHISMFINRLMYGGKKSTARRIMYDALDIVAERTSKDPVEVFDTALRNVRPTVEVKPRRVGGSTYQVPVDVKDTRAVTLAMRWLIDNSRSRGGRTMASRLAAELMDAANGQGNSVRRRDEVHRMAEANRAFAHFK